MVWDRATGLPLHNAIVWLDNRTQDVCHAMQARLGSKDYFRPGEQNGSAVNGCCCCCGLRQSVLHAALASSCRKPSLSPPPLLPSTAVTGLPVSTYFSAYKLKWLMENAPAVAAAASEGRAQFGTVDSWLTYNMTGQYGCVEAFEGGEGGWAGSLAAAPAIH